MADPHFKLYGSVYEINKIIHERLEIWNSFSRVQFDLPLEADQTELEKVNSLSQRAHVLFFIFFSNKHCGYAYTRKFFSRKIGLADKI